MEHLYSWPRGLRVYTNQKYGILRIAEAHMRLGKRQMPFRSQEDVNDNAGAGQRKLPDNKSFW